MLPRYDVERTETPSPVNPMGVKGAGEAGTIGAAPAVVNAIVDALSHMGVDHLDMPITPQKVWQTIRAHGHERV
jgi:carbon-monoxide dehydrogenase large subunit